MGTLVLFGFYLHVGTELHFESHEYMVYYELQCQCVYNDKYIADDAHVLLFDVARHVVCVGMCFNFQLLGAHKRKWLGIICTLIDRECLLSSIHKCDCKLGFDVLVVY